MISLGPALFALGVAFASAFDDDECPHAGYVTSGTVAEISAAGYDHTCLRRGAMFYNENTVQSITVVPDNQCSDPTLHLYIPARIEAGLAKLQFLCNDLTTDPCLMVDILPSSNTATAIAADGGITIIQQCPAVQPITSSSLTPTETVTVTSFTTVTVVRTAGVRARSADLESSGDEPGVTAATDVAGDSPLMPRAATVTITKFTTVFDAGETVTTAEAGNPATVTVTSVTTVFGAATGTAGDTTATVSLDGIGSASDGAVDGTADWTTDGATDGAADGVADGAADGATNGADMTATGMAGDSPVTAEVDSAGTSGGSVVAATNLAGNSPTTITASPDDGADSAGDGAVTATALTGDSLATVTPDLGGVTATGTAEHSPATVTITSISTVFGAGVAATGAAEDSPMPFMEGPDADEAEVTATGDSPTPFMANPATVTVTSVTTVLLTVTDTPLPIDSSTIDAGVAITTTATALTPRPLGTPLALTPLGSLGNGSNTFVRRRRRITDPMA